MTQYTPKAVLPYAELTDAANLQTFGQALTTVLDGIVSPKYALLSDRAAANPSPSGGDCCYVGETDKYYIYSSTVGAWIYNTPWCKYKPTGTGRSGTSQSDDPHLTFAVEASSVYKFTMGLAFITSAAGGGWANTVSVPASATVEMMGLSLATTESAFNAVTTNFASTPGLQASASTASGGDNYNSTGLGIPSIQSGTLVTSGAGTFACKWAQHASSGTTTLVAGSWMEIMKIG
jgi:hypothetical protein